MSTRCVKASLLTPFSSPWLQPQQVLRKTGFDNCSHALPTALLRMMPQSLKVVAVAATSSSAGTCTFSRQWFVRQSLNSTHFSSEGSGGVISNANWSAHSEYSVSVFDSVECSTHTAKSMVCGLLSLCERFANVSYPVCEFEVCIPNNNSVYNNNTCYNQCEGADNASEGSTSHSLLDLQGSYDALCYLATLCSFVCVAQVQWNSLELLDYEFRIGILNTLDNMFEVGGVALRVAPKTCCVLLRGLSSVKSTSMPVYQCGAKPNIEVADIQIAEDVFELSRFGHPNYWSCLQEDQYASDVQSDYPCYAGCGQAHPSLVRGSSVGGASKGESDCDSCSQSSGSFMHDDQRPFIERLRCLSQWQYPCCVDQPLQYAVESRMLEAKSSHVPLLSAHVFAANTKQFLAGKEANDSDNYNSRLSSLVQQVSRTFAKQLIHFHNPVSVDDHPKAGTQDTSDASVFDKYCSIRGGNLEHVPHNASGTSVKGGSSRCSTPNAMNMPAVHQPHPSVHSGWLRTMAIVGKG